jgi:hypothetical protein
MHTLVKTVRDAELTLIKNLEKAKESTTRRHSTPKNSRAVRVYVAMRFPERQDACVEAIQTVWVPETVRVDDANVRALLAERDLIKDKR